MTTQNENGMSREQVVSWLASHRNWLDLTTNQRRMLGYHALTPLKNERSSTTVDPLVLAFIGAGIGLVVGLLI